MDKLHATLGGDTVRILKAGQIPILSTSSSEISSLRRS
jgi:hypothetical protein